MSSSDSYILGESHYTTTTNEGSEIAILKGAGFVIINYAETTRFRVLLTSGMALNDPQNPPHVIIESILQRKFHRH